MDSRHTSGALEGHVEDVCMIVELRVGDGSAKKTFQIPSADIDWP